MPESFEENLTPEEQTFLKNDEASDADTKEAVRLEKLAAQGDPTATPAPTPAPTAAPAPAATPAPTAAPAGAPSPTPAPTAAPGEKQSMVPHGALHEERELRKQTEQRLDKLLKAITGEEKPAPQRQAPDPDKDALGALKMTVAEVQELKRMAETAKANERVVNELQTVGNKAAQLERDYLQTLPDYDAKVGNSPEYQAAAAHLQGQRAAELRELGYDNNRVVNPDGSVARFSINEVLMQDAMTLANVAMAQGKNPAETVMRLAKARGFAYTATPAPAGAPSPTPAPMSEADKIRNAAQGQRENKSLGGGTGSSPADEITGAAVARMSDHDFEVFLEKISNDPKKMREAFGA
jgi:hypothetical protein